MSKLSDPKNHAPAIMRSWERIRQHWPDALWKVGLILGFLSMFLVWAEPGGASLTGYFSVSFAPSTSMAYFIQLPFVTLPNVLPTFLHPDVWTLAFGGAWLFLLGLLSQLFTRWGIVAQVAAIALFVPLIVMWPLAIGPGFVMGCVSAGMVVLGYSMDPRRNGAGDMSMRTRVATLGVALAILIVALGPSAVYQAPPSQGPNSRDPFIADMLEQVDDGAIYSTVLDLQGFATRYYGTPGNLEAAAYLFNRLSSIPGLEVEYQGGELRNVIATLPGKGASSHVYMVGAHYDSESSDVGNAPGATDNGGGVAIVLELARVMSQYSFESTIKFALWNTEEGGAGIGGSQAYVRQAVAEHTDVALYMNLDSSCYDPGNRFVLDIMHNDRSAWASEMMTAHNALYGIGFNLTYKVHNSCGSDHRSFWSAGYPAVMTHEEVHGPAHSADDTIDQVSTLYAKKNGQLCMSVLAELAGRM